MFKTRQEFKGGSWQIYASEINRLKEKANINYSGYLLWKLKKK